MKNPVMKFRNDGTYILHFENMWSDGSGYEFDALEWDSCDAIASDGGYYAIVRSKGDLILMPKFESVSKIKGKEDDPFKKLFTDVMF